MLGGFLHIRGFKGDTPLLKYIIVNKINPLLCACEISQNILRNDEHILNRPIKLLWKSETIKR